VGLIETQSTLPLSGPILETYTSVAIQCRCGNPVPRDGKDLGIKVVPWSLQAHFLGGVFWSRKCVRAFILEQLEILYPLDTPNSVAMISDLHDLYSKVPATRAEIPA
jgi:hypothetical protein